MTNIWKLPKYVINVIFGQEDNIFNIFFEFFSIRIFINDLEDILSCKDFMESADNHINSCKDRLKSANNHIL